MQIGVDIGGSKLLVVAGNDRHEIVRQQKVTTPQDPSQALQSIMALIGQVAAGDSIAAIGIGAAGPLDREHGITHGAPILGWKPLSLVAPLKQRFSVPVQLENDADVAGLAEATMGSAKGQRYVLYVTLSTGIGTGLIIDGQIYAGATDPEGGHIIIDPHGPVCDCGGRGHFESMASGGAIKRDYGKYGYEITDPKTWDEIAATMALGFHTLITAYAPSMVVVGGGVGVHFDQFGEFLKRHLAALKPLYPLPPIVQAQYTETAVAYGALILASRLAAKPKS